MQLISLPSWWHLIVSLYGDRTNTARVLGNSSMRWDIRQLLPTQANRRCSEIVQLEVYFSAKRQKNLTSALIANMWICHQALTNCYLFCRVPMSSPAGTSRTRSRRHCSWCSSPHWQTWDNCWDLTPPALQWLILLYKLVARSLALLCLHTYHNPGFRIIQERFLVCSHDCSALAESQASYPGDCLEITWALWNSPR